MIASGRLFEFVTEFITLENDRILWELYLHKVLDKSFAEFKASVAPEPANEDVETTVNASRSILETFIPLEQGVNANGAI